MSDFYVDSSSGSLWTPTTNDGSTLLASADPTQESIEFLRHQGVADPADLIQSFLPSLKSRDPGVNTPLYIWQKRFPENGSELVERGV